MVVRVTFEAGTAVAGTTVSIQVVGRDLIAAVENAMRTGVG